MDRYNSRIKLKFAFNDIHWNVYVDWDLNKMLLETFALIPYPASNGTIKTKNKVLNMELFVHKLLNSQVFFNRKYTIKAKSDLIFYLYGLLLTLKNLMSVSPYKLKKIFTWC